MKCLAFNNRRFLPDDSVSEVQADAFHCGQPRLNGEEIIISGRSFVAQATLDYGEEQVLLLPCEKRCSKAAERILRERFPGCRDSASNRHEFRRYTLNRLRDVNDGKPSSTPVKCRGRSLGSKA